MSLPLSESNYLLAHNAITARYANKRQLATYHFLDIFKYAKPNKLSFRTRQTFRYVHSNAVNVFNQLNIDLADFILFSLAYANLDSSTRSMLEESLSSDEIPRYQQLMDYVTSRLRVCELLEMHPAHSIQPSKPTSSSSVPNVKPTSPLHRRKSIALIAEQSTPKDPSPALKEGCFFVMPQVIIYTYTSTDFLLLNIDSRYDEINRLYRCYCC